MCWIELREWRIHGKQEWVYRTASYSLRDNLDRKGSQLGNFSASQNFWLSWPEGQINVTVLTFWGADRIAPPQRERNSKKTNRTTFFGWPSDRLFFCRSERSINIAPTAGGNGTIMEIHSQGGHPYRPMTQNRNRHVYGNGRSSFRRSFFLYRTGFREVNPNDQINYRKEDYKHDYQSICRNRNTLTPRTLRERRAACTLPNASEKQRTASRSQ